MTLSKRELIELLEDLECDDDTSVYLYFKGTDYRIDPEDIITNLDGNIIIIGS